MKTIKFWVFVALLASPIFIYAYFRATADSVSTMTVNHADDASWVRMDVQKPNSRQVLVRLTDTSGDVIAYQRINRHVSEATVRFGLAKLPVGTYHLELQDRHTVDVHEILLDNRKAAGNGRELVIRQLLN